MAFSGPRKTNVDSVMLCVLSLLFENLHPVLACLLLSEVNLMATHAWFFPLNYMQPLCFSNIYTQMLCCVFSPPLLERGPHTVHGSCLWFSLIINLEDLCPVLYLG
jgi:hypothetical protein